jgi:hypothetical protein
MGRTLAYAAAVALMPMVVLGASSDRAIKPPAKSVPATTPAKSVPATASTPRTAGPSFGRRSTAIMVSAWNADDSPLKQAPLRLRDVVTGKAGATVKGDDAGQFAFENIEAGSYVIELLDESGRIRSVGHVFTIASGETVATFVRVETKVPWVSAFFSNTASAVAASAASQGITALTPLGRCVSPPGCRP